MDRRAKSTIVASVALVSAQDGTADLSISKSSTPEPPGPVIAGEELFLERPTR